MEVWENEKLKWEHETVGRVFRAISSSPKFSRMFLLTSLRFLDTRIAEV